MGLGKKYTDIEEPQTPIRTSQAGSGVLILIAGTEISNPNLDVDQDNFTTQINNSPAFDAPSIAWS